VLGSDEARYVADLGHEDSGQDRADTGDCLDGVVADVVFEPVGDPTVELGHLPVVNLDQVAK
jgi:hypothetical protein